MPINHGTALRNAVMRTNKQVEWVEYPEEGHGWALEKNRIDFWGRVEKFLDPKTKADAVCEKCTDDRKDQPVVGMNILRGVRQSASDPTLYEGGTIVDPNNGKVYRNRLKPVNGGQQLEMRGYLGPFYRTQTWQRVQ